VRYCNVIQIHAIIEEQTIIIRYHANNVLSTLRKPNVSQSICHLSNCFTIIVSNAESRTDICVLEKGQVLLEDKVTRISIL